MNMRHVTVGALLLVAGAGGYLCGARTPSRSALPGVACVPEAMAAGAPAGPTPPHASGECQAVKNQLAICMAFRPSEDEKDKQLAMCRGDLGLYKNRPTLPDCYDFMDMAPTYDRELGELDPSPETLERAKSLSVTECVRVITWADRARKQHASCLRGEPPPGFKERHGRLVDEHPFVKACQADALKTDVLNAWLRREEDRVREMGHPITHRVRVGPDGGVRVGPPSSIPDEN